nr:hypothetical protein [Tanacetum cinerariifolium]
MTTPNVTSSTDSQMHNNIMVAGSRDCLPMLATGRYNQWRSRFLRYINTRPKGEALRKCILSGPYKPTTVLVQAVEATDDSLAVPEHTTVETPMNMSPENKDHFLAEKEAIHLILTGIRDEIYSTVDACQIAHEMWEAMKGYNKNILKLQKPKCRHDTTVQDDDHSGQFRNQRTVNVAGAREKVGSPVVQQSGIQCFNCKEFRHFAKEYTDEEVDEQELEAHYSYMDKIHSQWNSNTCLVETDDSNAIPDSSDMCEDDIQNEQNDVKSDDERVALANLIANLKLDVDENKKIQKQLKKANTTLAQELKECKAILAETSKSLGESISVRDSCPVALQTKQTELEKYKAFNDRTIDYDK